MKKGSKVEASPLPDGSGHQVTYESGSSRKLHQFPCIETSQEPSPHGAGSFHDPEHHQVLMSRFENYIQRSKPQS